MNRFLVVAALALCSGSSSSSSMGVAAVSAMRRFGEEEDEKEARWRKMTSDWKAKLRGARSSKKKPLTFATDVVKEFKAEPTRVDGKVVKKASKKKQQLSTTFNSWGRESTVGTTVAAGAEVPTRHEQLVLEVDATKTRLMQLDADKKARAEEEAAREAAHEEVTQDEDQTNETLQRLDKRLVFLKAKYEAERKQEEAQRPKEQAAAAKKGSKVGALAALGVGGVAMAAMQRGNQGYNFAHSGASDLICWVLGFVFWAMFVPRALRGLSGGQVH